MAEETANIRQERVERLLNELRYEIERGIIEGDLDETMDFRFVVPVSRKIPKGHVYCEFKTRPITREQWSLGDHEPRLRVVK